MKGLKKFFGCAKSQQQNPNNPPKNKMEDPSQLNPEIAAFLHGKLQISVLAAENVEGIHATSRLLGKIERVVTSSIDGVDPYCSVKLGYNKILQTSVVTNSDNPSWNSSIIFDVAHDFEALEFRIKAAKRQGPLSIISKVKHLSMLAIPAAKLRDERRVSGWFSLQPYQTELEPEDDDDQSDTSEEGDNADEEYLKEVEEKALLGRINVDIIYTPVHEIEDYNDVHVPNLYYPVRECGKLTLYQDADTPPGSLPQIPFHPDYQHSRCWIEMANAIMSATEFIYITGWAVWHQLVMVRTDDDNEQWKGLTLGEMLQQKADEGVTVCVMAWDEIASNKFYAGIMGTHDEELIDYFRRTNVKAIKVPRKNDKNGPFADLNDSLMFTHHQKTVIVSRGDSETGRNRVEAWLGGLDLTDGRYDNGSHSLFRTLNNLHASPDFWQACALGTSAESGPREPWHDIHSHLTGPAAWDVLENFETRWSRQAPESMKSVLHQHHPHNFVQLGEEAELCEGDWNIQILRSINQASAQLDTDRPGLIARAKAETDRSIHCGYVHCIRQAKHFIFLENQYFLGSSHMWKSGQRGGFASHLIPIEIAEKICYKIRRNERFAVYLNIPLYPEGPPDSGAVQEILSHQRKTIELITSRIAKAIEETGSDTNITDWFNVFCLVNRESPEGGEGNGGVSAMEKTLSESRRFMIYIHSKFAIFDDTIAIVGSANINSRSLDGSRDTEIAVMGWQPEHCATGSNGYGDDDDEGELPKGDVAAFRASVWSEHLGDYIEEFEQPSSIECVNKIRELARANWDHFASNDPESVTDMPYGHLALYPYEFDPQTGAVSTIQDEMPDFPNALIRGKASLIPNLLTG